MSEAQQKPTTEGSAKIVYILYLVGIVFGVTGIVGVVMAYITITSVGQKSIMTL